MYVGVIFASYGLKSEEICFFLPKCLYYFHIIVPIIHQFWTVCHWFSGIWQLQEQKIIVPTQVYLFLSLCSRRKIQTNNKLNISMNSSKITKFIPYKQLEQASEIATTILVRTKKGFWQTFETSVYK